ncbi:allophanate hydrolase, partial [Arthrobacter deserti]|nr:allophanate hydrolase [Arthrobacter deserti]
ASSPDYRLLVLPSDTAVRKVALVPAPGTGVSVAGELWRLSPHALGTLLDAGAPPQSLGTVRLADGSEACGFLADTT